MEQKRKTLTTTNNNTASASGGIGLFGLAFIALLVFKLAGMAGASWGLASLSWWWVFSPLLIGFGIWLLIVLVVVLIAVFVSK